MTPLFYSRSELVGQSSDFYESAFDKRMDWVSYIRSGNVWNATTGDWVGPFRDRNILDTNGRSICGANASTVRSAIAPIKSAFQNRPSKARSAMREQVMEVKA